MVRSRRHGRPVSSAFTQATTHSDRINLTRSSTPFTRQPNNAIEDGPVFRSLVNGQVGAALTGQSVSLVVKRRAAAGYAAADFAAGASVWKMREVSRHKSVQTLSDYVRNRPAQGPRRQRLPVTRADAMQVVGPANEP